MGLETGFYRVPNEQYPSVLDSAQKAVSLGSLGVQRDRLALQNQQLGLQTAKMKREVDDDLAMRAAFSKNINPDNSVNRAGVIADMGRVAPMKSMDVQEKFMSFDAKSAEYAAKQAEQQRKKLDDDLNRMGVAADLALSAKDQGSYDVMLNRMTGMGLDVSHMPQEFDPGYMRRLAYTSVKEKERIGAQKQQFDEAYRRQVLVQGDRKNQISDDKNQIMAKRYDQLGQNRNSNLVNNLRKERSQLPTTKSTQEVAVAYNKVQQAAVSGTAAGDISLVFGYMKMLDPGSVVREGEYATAKNATGVPTQILNMYNKLVDGTFLAPAQRKDFLTQAAKVYQSQMSQQRKVDANYTAIAQKNGIDPKDVLLNFAADEPVNPNIDRAKQLARAGGGKSPQRSTAQAPQGPLAPPPAGSVHLRSPEDGRFKLVPQTEVERLTSKGWSAK